MSWLARVFWALLAIALFFLAALAVNQDPVELRFLAWHSPTVSVFWWLLCAFLTGLLVGLVGITVLTTRLSLKSRRLNRELTETRQELQRVRRSSLQD